MHPLHLRLEGFTSYREPAEVDFAGLDLFAITGPTGAGKSSLTDAITFALFGKAPRVGSEIKDCIAQGMERMSVVFEFTVGDERYRVFRSTTRKGAAPAVQLDRFEGGEWRSVAGRVREINARIQSILGLDYEAFTRSVLLPQGQFHRFLAGEPKERRDVLTELLRLDVYTRIAQRARQMARDDSNRAVAKQHEINEYYKDATAQALEASREEHRSVATTVAELRTEEKTLSSGCESARRLSDANRRREEQREELDEASDELNQARRLLKEGEQELKDLEGRREVVDEEINKNRYDDELLTRLTKAAAFARQVEEYDARLADLAEQRTKATERLAQLAEKEELTREAHEAAARALDEVEDALEQARREHQAADLRRGLKPGDPCPVCGAPVGKLRAEKHAPLKQAQAHRDSAKRGEQSASKALQESAKAVAAARASAAALNKQMERGRRERDDKIRVLADTLAEGEEADLAWLDAMEREQQGAREERRRLEAVKKALDAEYAAKRSEIEGARENQATLAERVKAAKKALATSEKEIADQTKALRRQARAGGWTEVTAALDAARDPLPLLVRRLADCETELRQAEKKLTILEQRIKQIEEGIEKRGELTREAAELRERAGVADELSRLLRADRFIAFVENEALRILAEDGSRQLLDISGGRYTLEVDGRDFFVVDRWNAEEHRHVRTLSGGETFLASLALAVALAERLPELAGSGGQATMESLFLDEGFGALDDETRDVVAQALEALRMTNRMVCIITHVPELAERMPARIEVVKSESGSYLRSA